MYTRTFRRIKAELLEDRRMLASSADFNCDGHWDTTDLDSLTTAIAIESTDLVYDLDGDSNVSKDDLDAWLREGAMRNGFAEPFSLGDANLDGRVNSEDLNQLGVNWQSDTTAWSAGNFDPNSKIDSADLNALGLNWQKELAPAVGGNGTFAIDATYDVGSTPFAMTTGDYNGDGFADLATVSDVVGISVLFGQADGTFLESVELPNTRGEGIATGDFDNDGLDDIAFGTDNLVVLLGTADGEFAAPQRYSTGEDPYVVRVADLNGDAILDLAVLTESGIFTNLGDGDGTFTNSQLVISRDSDGGVVDLIVGDLDADGIADLAMSDIFFGIHLAYGQEDGTYATGEAVGIGGYDSATMGDVTGDGMVDLVGSYLFDNGITLMTAQSDGSFETSRLLLGTSVTDLSIADFNGDGFNDIAISTHFPDALFILLSRGDGAFDDPLEYPVDGNVDPNSIAISDFNGDAILDIATANFQSGSVSVFLGQSSNPARRAQVIQRRIK